MLPIFRVLLKLCTAKSNHRGNTLSWRDWPFGFNRCLGKCCGGFGFLLGGELCMTET